MGDGAENHVTPSELVNTELDSEEVTVVRVIQPANEVYYTSTHPLLLFINFCGLYTKCTYVRIHVKCFIQWQWG